MRTHRLLTTALTVALPLTWLGAARAGLPDKKTDRFGWIKASMAGTPAKFCGPLPAKKRKGGSDPDYVRKQVEGKWEGAKMGGQKIGAGLNLANALCKFPGNPDLQAALMPLWKQWTAYYGFGEADYADFAAVLDPNATRVSRDRAPKSARFADLDGVTQAEVAYNLAVRSYGMDFMSYAQMLDSAPKAAEHLKVAFVKKCIDGYRGSIARWAICKKDALSLDRKRFHAELAAAKLNAKDRIRAKIAFLQLQQKVKAAAAKHAADVGNDDGVKKVIETIPIAALAQWDKESAPYKELLAWVHKVVDDARARNKKLMNGCEHQLRKHLATYLQAKQPRILEDLKYAFRDNIGSQLAAAASLCLVRKPAAQKYWANASAGFAEHWGPRTAIWHALASAKIDFDTDRGRDPLGLPKPVILYFNGSSGYPTGPIAKMKEAGDTIEVSFKKITWKERICKAWRQTNKVDRIDFRSGKIIYRSYCTKYGTEKRSSQATPVTVDKGDAAGLKKKLPVRFVRDADGNGYPVTVFASNKRKKIIGAFGITY